MEKTPKQSEKQPGKAKTGGVDTPVLDSPSTIAKNEYHKEAGKRKATAQEKASAGGWPPPCETSPVKPGEEPPSLSPSVKPDEGKLQGDSQVELERKNPHLWPGE